jgi:HlyD family secretion protein
MMLKLMPKPENKIIIGLLIGGTIVSGGIAYYGLSQSALFGAAAEPKAVETIPPLQKISALGRIQPEAEVIKLSVPSALDGDRLAQLLVKEGDKVKIGQVVAIVDSKNRLTDTVEQALQGVRMAEAKLAQVKAGAKPGDIVAKQATVEQQKAQLLGDRAAQEQNVAQIQAQWEGDRAVQEQTIARIQAQWEGDKATQLETIARGIAQWQGEKKAQEATIKRLQAGVNNADAEFKRYQKLENEGAISNSLYDSKRLTVETTRQELNEAKAVLNKIDTTGLGQINEAKAALRRIDTTSSRQLNEAKAILNRINTTANRQINQAQAVLSRIENTGDKQVKEATATLSSVTEVRSVDVRVAQTEVDNAKAALKKAQTELEQALIRAPISGQVLKIHTRVGEKIADAGIAELAQNEEMMVVAEVYQTDIAQVKIGQKATITSPAIAGQLQGSVFQVGLQVNKQNVFSNQPGENLDRRIVEVKIRLNPEDSKKVPGLTNLQVQTAIEL